MHCIVHGIAKSRTQLSDIHFNQRTIINLCFLSFFFFFFDDNVCFLMEYQTAQQGHLEKFPPRDFAKMPNILMN